MTEQPPKKPPGNGNCPVPRPLSRSHERAFIAYNLVVALAFTVALVFIAGQKAAYLPRPESALAAEQAAGASQPGTTVQPGAAGEAGSGATAQSTPSTSPAAIAISGSASNVATDLRREPLDVLMPTLLTLIFAGGMGRMLCNLRGIVKRYHKDGVFPAKDALPFVIGPGMGAMVGLTTFFVATLFNAALADASSLTWAYFPDRFAYIALAIVGGFSSQEFLQRLKAVAQTTFSVDEEESREEPPPAETAELANRSEGQITV